MSLCDRRRPLQTLSFRPSASQEFNGAGLFYFAEFQAVAERALVSFFPPQLRHPKPNLSRATAPTDRQSHRDDVHETCRTPNARWPAVVMTAGLLVLGWCMCDMLVAGAGFEPAAFRL